jgi:hypothetical protein
MASLRGKFQSPSKWYVLLTEVSAGRFFANHLMKLLMAQIVLRYDIKPVTTPRPRNPWLSYVSPPPLGYKLSVKRRH